jgi:hypothetical protein
LHGRDGTRGRFLYDGLVRREFGLGLALACGCTQGTFACEDDLACGVDGMCQPEGWCSFPDDGCPSGQRFGEHSGEGLGGLCVDPFGTTGGGAMDSSGAPPDVTTAEDGATLDGPLDDTTASVVDDDDDDDEGDGNATSGEVTGDGDGTSTGAGVTLPEPIVWYSFDDLMDPYKDDSGNGHVTWCSDEIAECPIPVAGAVGLGVEFDGIVQHLHIDHGTWVETTTGLTFTAWVLLAPSDDGQPLPTMGIAMKPYGLMLESSSWVIGVDPTMGVIGAVVGEDPLAIAQGPYPFDDDWHHVSFAWDGATVRVYVDATEVGSAAATEIAFDSAVINLGAGVAAGVDAAFLRGALDEVRMYDVGLDAEQIAVLATPVERSFVGGDRSAR